MSTRVWWYLVGAGLGVGLASILAVVTGVDLLPVAGLLAAGAVVLTSAALALRHFAVLVLLLLLVRPELDAVGHSTASVVGVIFLGASVWWLFVRWREDRLIAPSPVTWAMIAFVMAVSLSTLGSHLPIVSAVGTARMATGLMMFVVIEQIVGSGLLPTKTVHIAVAGSAVLVCAHVALQMATGSAMIDDSSGLARVTGPFVHPSVLGKYAVVVTVLMAARAVWTRTGDRWLWGVGALVTGVVVLQTYTRAAWLALTLGAVVLCYRRDHRWLPVIVGGGMVGVLTVPSLRERLTNVWDPEDVPPGAPESSLAWRFGYWQDLLPLGRVNPYNGIGLDVVPALRSEGLLPHNVWVQTWVELGLIGMLALIGVVATVVLTLRRASRAVPETRGERRAGLEAALAVAVGLGVVTLSENLLDETTTLWYAATIMASGWVAGSPGASRDGDSEQRPWWLSRAGRRVRRARSVSSSPTRR